MPVLTVKDVKKVYGSKFGGSTSVALNGVSFEVEKGEFAGIMGPSGAGKSTLLNVIATIDTVLRRTYSYDNSEMDVVSYKGLIFNIGSGIASANGKEKELTKNEAQILALLLKNRGNAVSRERIMRSLWKDASFIDDNTLTVNITRLRKKLSDIGLENYIETKKNLGYMI